MFNKSFWLAFGLVVAIALWVASGYWGNNSNNTPAPVASRTPVERMAVQVRSQRAEPVVREIIAQGQVEANRRVVLRAETAGTISEVIAQRGQPVQEGDPIVQIALNDREAQLKKTEALVAQRERDYNAITKLGKTGFQAETQISQALAELEAARADLEEIRLDIAKTVIRAPFAGVLNERPVEVGSMVSVGDDVAVLVDVDPLIISAQVPQQSIDELSVGDTGTVRLVTGQQAKGTVRYISAVADEATRTFRVELEIPNPARNINVGISGELRLPVESVATHFVSPAQLSLDSDGVLGVKTVNGDNTVEFYPVSIVRAGSNGVWVAGLPAEARLITVGQGFVQTGEQVRALPEDESRVADLERDPARRPVPLAQGG